MLLFVTLKILSLQLTTTPTTILNTFKSKIIMEKTANFEKKETRTLLIFFFGLGGIPPKNQEYTILNYLEVGLM